MAGLSLAAVNLATMAAERFLYGVFFVLFVVTLFLFVRRAIRSQAGLHSALKMPLLLAAIGMFLSVTLHRVVTMIRASYAFAYWNDDPAAPSEYYGDMHATTRVANIAVGCVSIVIGDIVLIYRLWVIWDHSWPVIFIPLLSFCATIGCSAASVYRDSRANFRVSEAVPVVERDSGTYIVLIAVYTNLYSSFLICWKLWHVHHMLEMRRFGGSSLMRITAVFIQSAALILLWAILYFAVFLKRSNLHLTVIDTGSQMLGITFMLINVLVATGWTDRLDETPSEFVRRFPTVEAETLTLDRLRAGDLDVIMGFSEVRLRTRFGGADPSQSPG